MSLAQLGQFRVTRRKKLVSLFLWASEKSTRPVSFKGYWPSMASNFFCLSLTLPQFGNWSPAISGFQRNKPHLPIPHPPPPHNKTARLPNPSFSFSTRPQWGAENLKFPGWSSQSHFRLSDPGPVARIVDPRLKQTPTAVHQREVLVDVSETLCQWMGTAFCHQFVITVGANLLS